MISEALKSLSTNPYYQKYQVFIWPFFAVVISVSLVFLVGIPQVKKILEDEKVLAQTNQNYKKLQVKLDILQNIDSAFYQSKINTVLTALPIEKDIPGAVGQVLFLISSTNLRLDGITLSHISDSSLVEDKSYQIRLELTGSVDNLRNFTQKVRESPRVMKITSLEVAESRGTNQLQATIVLDAYYEPLPTTLGGVDQDLSPLSREEEEIIQKIEAFTRNTPISTGSGSLIIGKSDPFE